MDAAKNIQTSKLKFNAIALSCQLLPVDTILVQYIVTSSHGYPERSLRR